MSNPTASPGVALVAEYQVIHAGETYTLTRPTLQSELEYTRFLEAKTIQKLQVHGSLYGANLSKVIAENNLLLAAGAFEWGSARWNESLDVKTNVQEMSFLCARQNFPGLTRERWEPVFEANAAEIAGHVWKLIASPNSNSPAVNGPAQSGSPSGLSK